MAEAVCALIHGLVGYLDVHEADSPTFQQKKNDRTNYGQQIAVKECQTYRDQRSASKDEYAYTLPFLAGVKSHVGRLEVREQQTQGN